MDMQQERGRDRRCGAGEDLRLALHCVRHRINTVATEPLLVDLVDHAAYRAGGIEDALAQNRQTGGVQRLAATYRHHVALRSDCAQQRMELVDLLQGDAEGEGLFLRLQRGHIAGFRSRHGIHPRRERTEYPPLKFIPFSDI